MGMTDIERRVESACQKAERARDEVHLIAVSKEQPNERTQAVLEAGHRLFGENRVQEAQGKWPDFQERFTGTSVHLIGPLQSNKARVAMGLFQAIHTLDRPKLAQTLARLAQELGHCPDLFIQVNTGDEPQKAGITLGQVDDFIMECRALDLPICGLMCIPPVHEPPSLHFSLLGKIAARNGLKGLSMGMSADFEQAIALGATHIRVGSAIFGERDRKA